ncbi:MAG: pyocin knob domain-containing protein, partial [Fusobacteriaceae bacterium]
YPIAEAGTLLVAGSAYGAQQEYTTYSSYRKFIRGQGASGGKSWFPWKEVGGPKHHMSGINFTPVAISTSGTANLMPTMFPSYLGITMGDTVATVSRDGKYRIDWGFSVEPANLDQQAVGSIFVNSVETYPSIIYNYTPTNTAAVQMTISSTSLIVTLKAGDRLQFNVKSVNSKTARIFRAGHIVIQEL